MPLLLNATNVLAQNLDRLMESRGWGLVETATRSGVSKSAISNIRNYRDRGDKHPTTETVEALAKAFGLQAWQLMCPVAAQPVPEPLDVDLLRAAISGAANAFRSRGMLVDDERLAGAAAFLYRRVRDGTSLRSATDVVKEELSRFGANLAAGSNGSNGGKETREPTAKGTVRRGPAGTGRDIGRKRSRPRA